MGNKNKWNTKTSKDEVKVFKVPKSLYEIMNAESTDYKLLFREIVNSAQAVREANAAMVDMMFKVKDTGNEEAKKYWADRLEAVMKVIGLNSKMRDQLLLMQEDYNKLYDLYSEMRDRYKDLEEKLLKYESLEDE